jgi:hypothetical protein
LPEWEPGLIAIIGNAAVLVLISGASHLVSQRLRRASGRQRALTRVLSSNVENGPRGQ